MMRVRGMRMGVPGWFVHMLVTVRAYRHRLMQVPVVAVRMVMRVFVLHPFVGVLVSMALEQVHEDA